VPQHAIFEGVPHNGMMGREFGNVIPAQSVQSDWIPTADTGSAVQIYKYGNGKILLTSLNLLPNLGRDALAEKLLCNLVNDARQGLPAELASEKPQTVETLRFEEKGYEDCLRKFLEPRPEG
jgi:hypothetical protein